MSKTPEEVCEQLAKITKMLPAFQLKIPLLSWEHTRYNAVNKLVQLLRAQGIEARRSQSMNYDSYAASDWDLCVVLGHGYVLQGQYNYRIIGSRPEFYGDTRLFHLRGNSKAQYDLETELRILDVIYGPGNYKILTRASTTLA